MKCRKCKSTEHNPSRRNPVERIISQILPVRPYRCSSCEARFWWLDKPLFGIGRVVFAAAILLVFAWFAISIMLSGSPPEPLETAENTSQQVAQNDASEPDNPDVAESETSGALPVSAPEEGSDSGEELASASDMGDGDEANSEEDAPSEIARENEDLPVSDFVKAQLARNRNRTGNEGGADTVIEKEATPTATNAPQTSAPKPAEPRANPAASASTSDASASRKSGVAKSRVQPAGSGRIQSIQFNPSNSSLTIGATGTLPKPRFFRLDNPRRMIVDLPGAWSASSQLPRILNIDSDHIQQVRSGVNKNYFRLVFDLNAPCKDPEFAQNDSELVIRLEKR